MKHDVFQRESEYSGDMLNYLFFIHGNSAFNLFLHEKQLSDIFNLLQENNTLKF